METKKFRVTFEFDATPYNKDTYKLLGPCFMTDYPDTVFASEDLGRLFQDGLIQRLQSFMKSMSDDSANKEYHEKYNKRMTEMYSQMRDTVKIESID